MAMDPVVGPVMTFTSSAITLMCQLSFYLFFLTILLVLAILLIIFIGSIHYCTISPRMMKSRGHETKTKIGFFHPYCNAGGGGERVLWKAISAMKVRFPNVTFVVFTGDIGVAPDQILQRVRNRFGVDIELDDNLEFFYLHKRNWIEASNYPYFTLMLQSIASIFLGLEAMKYGPVDVLIDTMGYAFIMPLFKFFMGCKTACYVHYPTISTDMFDKVQSSRQGYNNRRFIANSRIFTKIKLGYYHAFSFFYRLAGRTVDVVMVNSSWTEGHIGQLWGCQDRHEKIFPPCDIEQFSNIQRRDTRCDKKKIISLGQFRDEKDQPLQIRSLARLRDMIFSDNVKTEEEKDKQWEEIQLVLIGGCRNQEDEERVKGLKNLCKHLAVDSNVVFKTNLAFEDLKQEVGEGLAGIHTMWNEHFGIAVVEMMAAGLITIAHRSGGPLMDIVIESPAPLRTGFLAITEQEYADAIFDIFNMTVEAKEDMRARAASSVQRFSDAQFEKSWIRATENLVKSVMQGT